VDLRQTVPKASDGMTPEEKAELEAKRELARQKRYYRHKKDLHALLKDRDDIRNYAVKQREKAEVRFRLCFGSFTVRPPHVAAVARGRQNV
jgi:hypothetical protein